MSEARASDVCQPLAFECIIHEDCDAATRAKVEKELARIGQGKLPLGFPRNHWQSYSSRHWRNEARKDAELVRLYTENVGHAPDNAGASEQWLYNPRSPKYRGRALELVTVAPSWDFTEAVAA